MAETLKPYIYEVHGIKHTILCTEADAAMYGATPAEDKAASKAAVAETKIRFPQNKSAD